MFRIRACFTNTCLACFDLTVTAICYMAVLQWESSRTAATAPALGGPPLLALVIICVLWVVLATHFHLYHSRRLDSPLADAMIVLKVGLASWIVLEEAARLFPQFTLTTVFVLRFEAVNTLALMVARLSLRLVLRELRSRGRNVKNLVLVATPDLGNRVAEKIERRAHFGYRIVQRLPASGGIVEESTHLLDELKNTLNSMPVEDVIIALPAAEQQLTARLAGECENRGIGVRIIPDLFPLIGSESRVYDLDGIPLVNVRPYPTEYLRYAVLKRVFDVCTSSAVLVIFSPLYALIAVCIRLTSSGPILFVQERVGLNGKKFNMLKFRTMRMDFDPETHWTVANDPHVTPLGRFLRSSNLDEIPQFWNVLKGDMSIVGPRPERPVFLERFRQQVPEYMARHYVKGGITGWAQVNGWRGDTSISQRIACDLYYIRNWAFGFDLKIVFLTVLRSFFHRNAY